MGSAQPNALGLPTFPGLQEMITRSWQPFMEVPLLVNAMDPDLGPKDRH